MNDTDRIVAQEIRIIERLDKVIALIEEFLELARKASVA